MLLSFSYTFGFAEHGWDSIGVEPDNRGCLICRELLPVGSQLYASTGGRRVRVVTIRIGVVFW